MAAIGEVSAPTAAATHVNVDPEQEFTDKELDEAQRVATALTPLLDRSNRTAAAIKDCAKLLGVHPVTVRRRLEKLEQTGSFMCFVKHRPTGGRGKSRLTSQQNELIRDKINGYFLKKIRPSPAKLIREIKKEARKRHIPMPHPNTLRKRVAAILPKVLAEHRFGRNAAREFLPHPDHYGEAEFPLSVVQIDHTPLPVIILDPEYRRPMGRAWITLAIDVFSRMVLGFYISSRAPSAASVGMCIANAILPKDGWISKFGLNGDWPCFGLFGLIHADNAREFRGNMVRQSAMDWGMDLQWRPVKQPEWGGHIERLLGTVCNELRDVPGSTFASASERGEYDSEGNAILTEAELKKWLAMYFVETYHNKVHSELGTTPRDMYEKGMTIGTDKVPARGWPEPVTDERKLRIDFLPFYYRAIGPEGVVIDYFHYYHPILQPHINENIPGKKKKVKFMFRRDPNALKVIHFWDRDHKEYRDIPFKNITRPNITIWEQRKDLQRLREEGRKVNEDNLFAAADRRRELEEIAARKTQSTRKSAAARRSIAQRPEVRQAEGGAEQIPPRATHITVSDEELDGNSVEPFDGLEDE